jgi:hypothetical protein
VARDRAGDPFVTKHVQAADIDSPLSFGQSGRVKLGAGIVVFLCALPLSACSGGGGGPTLPSFHDVSDAPPAIQTAARAVVRIRTAGAFATGSFISPTGVLLTNNHVLGVDVCPLEGCYARLAFLHQRHSSPQPDSPVFVVPLAVDVGLDMAVLQVYQGPGSAPLDTPDYLTLASRDPASLRGTHVRVVGHPEGHLKKWTEGDVVDSDGTWIFFTAFSLPGDSGSPVLDDGGHLVGILHRGPTAQDLVSNTGIDEYSIGTASSALIPAMRAPLPAAMQSIAAMRAGDDEVAQHQAVYLNAHVATATIGGGTRNVLASLGAACDAGLARQDYASPEDLSSALAPCSGAELWIECRGDAMSGAFGVCPLDQEAWVSRFQGVYDHWRALNGELSLDEVSFARAALSGSMLQGVSTGGQSLVAALSAANAPLDFRIAVYLAAFDLDSYAGIRLVDSLHGYANSPGYALYGTDIAAAALWLLHYGLMGRDDTVSFLEGLAADSQVDIGTKLYVEEALYEGGALD